MDKLEEKLIEYNEKFDDVFPTSAFRGLTEKEIIKLIQKCIDENKKYVGDLSDDPDVIY